MGLVSSCCKSSLSNASFSSNPGVNTENDDHLNEDPGLNVQQPINCCTPPLHQYADNHLINATIYARDATLMPRRYDILKTEVDSPDESSYINKKEYPPHVENIATNCEAPTKTSKKYKKKKKGAVRKKTHSNFERGRLQKCQLPEIKVEPKDIRDILTDEVNPFLISIDASTVSKWNRFDEPCQIFEVGGECFVEKREWGDDYEEFEVLTDTESLEDEGIEVSWNGRLYNVGFYCWNMISTLKCDRFYCMVCRLMGDLKTAKDHCSSSKHIENLRNCHVVDVINGILVRKVDDKYYHCGHCNNLELKNNIRNHINLKHSREKPGGKVQSNEKNHEKHENSMQTDNVCEAVGYTQNIHAQNIPADGIREQNGRQNEEFINLFGYKIKYKSFHLIFERQADYFCGACQISVAHNDLNQHINEFHLDLMASHSFIAEYDKHFLRKFPGGVHCAICHIVIHDIKLAIKKHIHDELHISLQKNALIDQNTFCQCIPLTFSSKLRQNSLNLKKPPLTYSSVLKNCDEQFDANKNEGKSVKRSSKYEIVDFSQRDEDSTGLIKKIQDNENNNSKRHGKNLKMETGNLKNNSIHQRDRTKEVLLEPQSDVPNANSGGTPAQIKKYSTNQSDFARRASDFEEHKEIVVDGQTYKLNLDAFHSLCRFNGALRCVLCNVRVENKTAHIKTYSHLQTLTYSFQIKYLPSLIRQAPVNAHCCICNLKIPNNDSNITDHIRGKTHSRNIKKILDECKKNA